MRDVPHCILVPAHCILVPALLRLHCPALPHNRAWLRHSHLLPQNSGSPSNARKAVQNCHRNHSCTPTPNPAPTPDPCLALPCAERSAYRGAAGWRAAGHAAAQRIRARYQHQLHVGPPGAGRRLRGCLLLRHQVCAAGSDGGPQAGGVPPTPSTRVASGAGAAAKCSLVRSWSALLLWGGAPHPQRPAQPSCCLSRRAAGLAS